MNYKHEEGRIYSLDEAGELNAEVTYTMADAKTAVICRTFVSPELRGQGVAGELLKLAAEHLREKGFKAYASCPYAHAWFEKHKDAYKDVYTSHEHAKHPACSTEGSK